MPCGALIPVLDGVNLAGISRVFALEDDNERLAARNDELEAENRRLRRS